jgi:putative ABC transport system permease protein
VALVATFGGLIDSFLAPLDRARAEAQRVEPDRLLVQLDRFRPSSGGAVAGIEADPVTGAARPQDTLAVTFERGPERIAGALTIFDPARPGWRPSLREGSFTGASRGVLLARQAARDLGVEAGGTITIRHPRLGPGGRVGLVRSRVRVDGIHGGTIRSLAYGASRGWDPRTGLTGLANQVEVLPAPGVSRDEAIRGLFGQPGVASVSAASAPYEALGDYVDRFLGFIYATEAFILLLALLVAFNSAAISADERRREHATMFAYGVPRRVVLGQAVAESTILGVLAGAVGVLLGLAITGWMVASIVPETLPDLEVSVQMGWRTLLVAAGVGILACALAPLLTGRRLRRMNVADTLRVME